MRRGAGCLWLVVSSWVILTALLAGAVSINAFALLGPLALATATLGILLLLTRQRWPLWVSVLSGLACVGLGIAAFLGSSNDFSFGIAMFIALSVAVAAMSAIPLTRDVPEWDGAGE